MNQNQIPHFMHHAKGSSNRQHGFVGLDGEFLHEIGNSDEFYKVFGYTGDMAKAGILPDEFIWDEYIKDAPVVYDDCLQIHIIEYLLKHSEIFRKKYAGQCESWIASHVEAVTARGVLCVTCRMKPFCSKREMITERPWVPVNNAARSQLINPYYKPTLEEEIAVETLLDACFTETAIRYNSEAQNVRLT